MFVVYPTRKVGHIDAKLGSPLEHRLKGPDTIVQHDDGAELAIEFGGRYDVQRIREFHLDCVRQRRTASTFIGRGVAGGAIPFRISDRLEAAGG